MVHRKALAGIAASLLLASTGCTPGQSPAAAPESEPAASPARTEISGPRVAVTYDGGLLVLDGDSLKVVADIPKPGFLRLNQAGDQRHVFVSTAEGFQLFDTGVEAVGHGDHFHYYAGPPALTDVLYPAPKPGHVVHHHDKVALFADGTGAVQVRPLAKIAEGPAEQPTWTAPHPHHGLAVPLENDQLLVSVGDEQQRTGAAIIDKDGRTVLENNECPGVHGHATVAGERTVVGCTDGVLVYDRGAFTKVSSPDAYGRIGNQFGSMQSPITLGDYKVDKDAELERPTRISLTDTANKSLRLVELGSAYSFRSFGRGAKGEALVLTTDGNLNVIDPATGEVSRKIKVTDPWEEPLKWQRERPSVAVAGGIVLVSEPSKKTIHQVHLDSGKVADSVELPHAPNEIAPLLEAEEHGHHHD